MNRVAVAAGVVVLLNLLVATAHGLSHARSGVPLEPWQMALILVAVYAPPLLSAVLYWTRLRRFAAALLAGSMAAGTAFGVYYHFVADTVDHVAHRTSDEGGALFVATATLFWTPAGLLVSVIVTFAVNEPVVV